MSYEEKPARGVPAAGVMVVGAALCLAAIAIGGARVTSALYWMILGVPLVLMAATFFVLRAVKPQVLRRRWGTDPIERGFELPLLFLTGGSPRWPPARSPRWIISTCVSGIWAVGGRRLGSW